MFYRTLIRPISRKANCSVFPVSSLIQSTRGIQSTRFTHNTLHEASQLTASEKVTLGSSGQWSEYELATGIITKDKNEGLVYFDNVYPPFMRMFPHRLDWILNRLVKIEVGSLQKKLTEHAIPEGLPVKLTNITPRMKDGGIFVRFTAEDPNSSLTTQEIETALTKHFNENPYSPWYSVFMNPVRIFPVRGTPWIEDLRRQRNRKVRVVFHGEDLSQEILYSVLRRYGPIADIIPPKPGDPEPRAATVEFACPSDAATARNCTNGLSLKGGKTYIHLHFVASDSQNAIRKFIIEHPRIVIPVLFALLATLTVMIFEPIRIFSIRHRITGKWVVLEGYPTLNKIKSLFVSLFSTMHTYVDDSFKFIGWSDANSRGTASNLWESRKEAIEMLRQWIDEGVGTFIVIYGPRGSGKDALVRSKALKRRDNVLTIDCDSLVKTRSDSAFILASSKTLGYYPVFPWMNSISSFLDLIAQGITGQKTGFSESIETQFKNMLTTAGTAVNQTATEKRVKEQEVSRENYLQLHPENKPVILIKNFVSKSEDPKSFVYRQLADWAAALIQQNVAHVIFVTDDVAFDKTLEKALPNQVFQILPVGDASKHTARKFVLEQLETSRKNQSINEQKRKSLGIEEDEEQQQEEPKPTHLEGLDEALEPVGGRMTDLQAFARRLKSGETPQQAAKDMIEQAKIEVLLMFVSKSTERWTKEQVWTLIKMLSARQEEVEKAKTAQHRHDTGKLFGMIKGEDESREVVDESNKKPEDCSIWLSVDTLCQDSNFASPQQMEVLNELEKAEMVTLNNEAGRVIAVKAGKPLYQAAFNSLAKDKSLSSWMESQILNMMISKENASIRAYETELESLAKLPAKWEIKSRIDYLSTKLYGCQERIEKYEKDLAHQKKISQKEKEKGSS